jgi:hypothetical protein
MNSDIYWSSIEYSYASKSSQSGKLKGGFVYAFVKALNTEEAISKVTKGLKHQNIEVKEVEFVSPYDIKTEWETEEQRNNFMELYKEAKSSNDVLFDTFYAFEVEE